MRTPCSPHSLQHCYLCSFGWWPFWHVWVIFHCGFNLGVGPLKCGLRNRFPLAWPSMGVRHELICAHLLWSRQPTSVPPPLSCQEIQIFLLLLLLATNYIEIYSIVQAEGVPGWAETIWLMGPESLIYVCDDLKNSLNCVPMTCAFSVWVSYSSMKLYQNRALPRHIRRGLRAKIIRL